MIEYTFTKEEFMKSHRNILIISFTLEIISLPFLIALNDGKLYEVMLAILTGALISFLLELPNYFSLKNENSNRLYTSLYSSKSQALYLINNIENVIKNNMSLIDKFYSQNVNNIDFALNAFESFDNDYYFFKRKNEKIMYTKRNLRNCWHNINLASLKFSIMFAKIKLSKIENMQSDLIFNQEMKNEINLILESCQNFIEAVDISASLILTKKQLNSWIVDNVALNNNELNFKITKA